MAGRSGLSGPGCTACFEGLEGHACTDLCGTNRVTLSDREVSKNRVFRVSIDTASRFHRVHWITSPDQSMNPNQAFSLIYNLPSTFRAVNGKSWERNWIVGNLCICVSTKGAGSSAFRGKKSAMAKICSKSYLSQTSGLTPRRSAA